MLFTYETGPWIDMHATLYGHIWIHIGSELFTISWISSSVIYFMEFVVNKLENVITWFFMHKLDVNTKMASLDKHMYVVQREKFSPDLLLSACWLI